jgi:hypothetical protein
MRSQRIRVPSAKARANAGLDFDLFQDPAEDFSISEQVSTTNNLPQATITEPIKSRKAKGKGKKKNTFMTPNTNEEASEDPKEPPKLYSILSQTKSARELRKDPATALFLLVVKAYASWDDIAVEGTPGDNPYADGALPAASLEPEAEPMDGYYSYPEFTLMPRAIH